MQSVQRQFGRFMKRSADESQVAVLLKDFDETDKLLGRIVESTRAWRDAWSSILLHQERMLCEFDGIYAPIIGSSDPTTAKAAPTPEATLARTRRLREEYEELRKELAEELNAVDQRMIRPASQAKEYLAPLKKTIKKREDRKLDYERHQSRVDSYTKKTKRSDRDNAALAKAETDLAKATEEYHAADEHLRKCLPPLINAAFSLLPQLLATQIEIQNTMLAHHYTVHFPSPAPPMEDIIAQWERDLHPIQQEIEALGCLANGKVVRMSQAPDDHGNVNGLSSRLTNGLNFRRRSSGQGAGTGTSHPVPPLQPAAPSICRDHVREREREREHERTSNSRVPSVPTPNYETKPLPVYETKPRLKDLTPSSLSPNLAVPSAHLSPSATPHSDSHLPVPGSEYAQTPLSGLSPNSSRSDYFSLNPRKPSSGSTVTSPGFAAAAAAKKKPPPPPAPRAGSSNGALYVTALYDFAGQSAGDLAFREGDRIRVLQKTNSTDDWWEGELRGVKGSFPANYVQ
ncbi:BAR and SH3 domain-containing protein [Aspergillus novofumigatus IBT 16806]|uniref:SH3 domain signaling protein n=1 Tax=Aspergillus novofumigatus (strain IBT 16806) TaxID=1392255 RepID=A0A2I1CHF8_ASPN1|nr:SH3 domain signaling protein [Aspergillus novofumigatus IBT 16806]PKX97030.1 SH3 domain signaling protein [Aspergillus novofumigatus IBT 16806]